MTPPQKTSVVTVYCRTTKSKIRLKSSKAMKYDITKPSAPKMPTPRKRDRMYPNPPLKGHKTPSAPLLPAPFTLSSAHIRAPETHPSPLIFEGICG